MNYFHILRKRLRTLGVKPKVARAISYDFDQQIVHRGLGGALSYFKNVGDTLIGYISGSKYSAPWVATLNGYPRKWIALKDYPIEVQLRVAKMARAIKLDYPTPSMVSKLRDAAVSDYSGTAEALDNLSSFQKEGLDYLQLYIPEFKFRFGTVARASRTYISKSVPSGTDKGLDVGKVLSTYYSWSELIHNIPGWQDSLYPIHTSWVNKPAVRQEFQLNLSNEAGIIDGVMEQGGKLRIFAAPSVLLQELLTPLQHWLDSIRDQVPTDVFRNQESGALWAQSKMNQGLEVQSIDLSSATCRYPFLTQLELLENLGVPPAMLNLYKAVARGRWKVMPRMVPYFGESMSWTVGQPLGVNPSMSSFALSHNLVLTGMCLQLGIDPQDSFRVLGDDVVCANSQLASLYRQTIISSGISISEHKSYNSCSYAEFAGYSILPQTMVRPGKWKAVHALNTQGLVKDLGENVILELSKETDRRLESILSFRYGTFTPDVKDYEYYLFMNSVLWDPETYQVPLKDIESDWYMGCTKHLRDLYPDIFFQPPTQSSMYISILKRLSFQFPGLKDSVGMCLGPIDPDTWTPYRLVVCLEAILANQSRDAQHLIDGLRVVKEEYEEFLWSLPVTSTSREKSQRKLLQAKYDALVS